jgi:TPR repeat protein
MRPIILTLLWAISVCAFAGKPDAIQYLKDGRYQQALNEFQSLARQGDHVAMVAIGNMHYQGMGIEQDYEQALNWWMKAYQLGNPDAVVNIGVLYRDGKGVERNLMIAYDIFLLIKVKELGETKTQLRNDNNLVKTVADMNEYQIEEALCYSEEYIARYLEQQGEGKIVQYLDELELKQKLGRYPGLRIPKYDCDKFRQ